MSNVRMPDVMCPVIACNLHAIDAAKRTRYHELVERVRAAIRNRSEIPDGYAFRLDSNAVGLPEIAEWISMERLCCAFLTLQLSTAGHQDNWLLTLTGPEGTKALLNSEFPSVE